MLLLAVLGIGLSPARGRADGAKAATSGKASDTAAASSPDALLGAMSFSSSREPISVSADALEFDYKTRVLTYKGSVVAVQGDMKLESDTLTVSLDEHAQNRVKEVVAEGQVQLTKGTRWATGGQAVFNQAQNTVVLSESAVVHDGPNEVRGDRVVVYLDQERSVVEGNVKAVLLPSKGEGLPPKGDAAPQTQAADTTVQKGPQP